MQTSISLTFAYVMLRKWLQKQDLHCSPSPSVRGNYSHYSYFVLWYYKIMIIDAERSYFLWGKMWGHGMDPWRKPLVEGYRSNVLANLQDSARPCPPSLGFPSQYSHPHAISSHTELQLLCVTKEHGTSDAVWNPQSWNLGCQVKHSMPS